MNAAQDTQNNTAGIEMYERIVVPLDGSQLAEVALPYAEELAGRLGSEIILFSVLESAEAEEHQRHHSYIKKVIEATQRRAKKYLNKPADQEIRVGSATRVGYPAEGIVNYANRGGFKLIIMATHGRSGLGRWALGSVADKVVRSTTRQPLLLIRARGARPDVRKKGMLKKALVPLDGSVRSQAVIPYISELAARLQTEITLMQAVPHDGHLYAAAESYLEGMCHLLEGEGITTRYQVRVGDAADEIINLADELDVDLVAMSTHGRTGLTAWTLGSVAQKVLLGGNTPLLLVRS